MATRVLAIGGPAHLQRFDIGEPLPSHTHFPVQDGEYNQYERFLAQPRVGRREVVTVYVATGMDLETAGEYLDEFYSGDFDLQEAETEGE